MFEQLPPFDPEAEASVLGSVLVDEEAMARVAGIVSPRDFFREANAWTFEACLAVWERDVTVNQITVAHEMNTRGTLEQLPEGIGFLIDLITNLPTPIGVEHFAAIVHRDAQYRRMLSVSMDIARIAYEADSNLDKSLVKAETLIHGLRANQRTESGFTHIRDLVAPYLDEPEEVADLRVGGVIRTGLAQLDALLDIDPTNFIVIAAPPGFGKTALMLGIARNAAIVQNAHVALFSLEMSGEELAQRFVQADARVTKEAIRRGRYTEAEYERLVYAIGLLGEAPIYIDSTPNLTPSDLRQRCIRLAQERGLDLVVVDYLQKMSSGSNRSRYDAVTEISGKLKELAMELDVPVIVGSQLSRDVKKRPDHWPRLDDLRESGAIEQDANAVVFIHLEADYYTPATWKQAHPKAQEPYPSGQANLIVAKQRSGQTGVATVRFRKQYTRFEDFDVAPAAPVQGRAW